MENLEVTDASLLKLVSTGDQEAMTLLYERHILLVRAVAIRVFGDAFRAADVVQDVFLQVWCKPLQFDSLRGNFRAFLATVTRNRCIDVLRMRTCDQLNDDLQIASSEDVAQTVEHRLMCRRVCLSALNLPRKQQDVLRLFYREGLTHKEIAAQTEQPLGTVKTRVRAAVIKLRRVFDASDDHLGKNSGCLCTMP